MICPNCGKTSLVTLHGICMACARTQKQPQEAAGGRRNCSRAKVRGKARPGPASGIHGARCPICRQKVLVTLAGKYYRHKRRRVGGGVCQKSGEPVSRRMADAGALRQ